MRRRPSTTGIVLDGCDRVLVNRLQDGLPLVAEPFAGLAAEIGISQSEVLSRISRLLDNGVLTRFGPFFDAAAMGGAFCLCAMAVPEGRFEAVTQIVNSFDAVAHNYARDHALNMWFVLATETQAGIGEAAGEIERATGLAVLQFPKLEEFYIGFRVAA